MTSNLLLLETPQVLRGIGSPRHELEWGGLYLDIVSFQEYVTPPPHTLIYTGREQSLSRLGLERDKVNFVGFEFNYGDYQYWAGNGEGGERFIDDLRWLHETQGLDLQELLPLGYIRSGSSNRPMTFKLMDDKNQTILEKIMEAKDARDKAITPQSTESDSLEQALSSSEIQLPKHFLLASIALASVLSAGISYWMESCGPSSEHMNTIHQLTETGEIKMDLKK